MGIPYTDMDKEITVSIVTHWDTRVVADLYRAGGWWKEEWNHDELTSLMRSSFAFAIAHTHESRLSVGMGRVISDGVSDAYIQDLVVIPAWRGKGVGKQILSTLIAYCHRHRITWIGLIAEPGTTDFYTTMGFSPLKGYIPMKFSDKTLKRGPADREGITRGVGNNQEKDYDADTQGF
jgi:GNAT superfamily N-acetyltransferase